MDLILHRAEHREGIGVSANRQSWRRPEQTLGVRQVILRRKLLAQSGVLHVSNHADDFTDGLLVLAARPNPGLNVLPDRILAGEKSAGKSFVDDDHRRRTLGVVCLKLTSFYHRDL